MNDEFLYRIRTDPPDRFARELKERLDRSSKRSAKLASLGFGLFLFGTAFALVSPAAREAIAGWFAGKPDQREIEQLVSAQAPERTSPAAPPEPPVATAPALSPADPPAEGEFPPDRASSADAPFFDGVTIDDERPTPEQRAARLMELLEAVEKHLAAEPASPEPSYVPGSLASLEEPGSSQNEFIVTGPLPAEPNTPAYAFQQRRSLFAVMAWAMEPVSALLKHQSEFDDARRFEVSGRRLEQLTRMIPDAFAYDSRTSQLQTRALDRVWEQPDLFAKRVEEMEIAARLLTIAALRGEERGLRLAAARVSFACTQCHQDFRKNGNNNVGQSYP